ncbi:MAG: DedA family protein [Myxococcota bacterium]
METIVHDALHALEGFSPSVVYALLALSASIEYLVPPFPGDTISLAGAVLATTSGFSVPAVWFALIAGSTAGGVIAWGFGRMLRANETRWPKGLRTDEAKERLDAVDALFARRGTIVLIANRFVPVFRSFFFVGAGLSNVRATAVVGYGALSAAAWNGIILTVAILLKENVTEMESYVVTYQRVFLGLGVAVLLAFGWFRWRRRAR